MTTDEELKELRELRDGVLVELHNYELNGSDAPAQIRGLYKDLEFVTNELRSAIKQRDKARLALANARKRLKDYVNNNED